MLVALGYGAIFDGGTARVLNCPGDILLRHASRDPNLSSKQVDLSIGEWRSGDGYVERFAVALNVSRRHAPTLTRYAHASSTAWRTP